jgi:alkylation response protein AidB-like acyl-CoA dehydrogenase
MWGTGADRADYVWLAARTDPDASPRHAGITVFLAPVGGPGWELQAHRSLSGEVSCTTFFDGMRIPDSCRVGPVNGGWKVVVDALASERVLMAGIAASLLRQLDDLVDELRAFPDLAGPPGSAGRRTLQEIAVRLQATRALGIAGIRATARGAGARLEAPMAKVLSGELAEDFGEAALQLLGPEAALSGDVPGVPGGGAFEYGLRWSINNVVGGGTGDIQRNLIARALGLPRS